MATSPQKQSRSIKVKTKCLNNNQLLTTQNYYKVFKLTPGNIPGGFFLPVLKII